MNIKYEFVTGEIVEVEVSDDIGEISIELDRGIYNVDHRETRRHNSVENLQEQGIQLIDDGKNVELIIEKHEMCETLKNVLDKLLPQQRELIQKVFFEGVSVSDIARKEGVDKSAISHRLNRIYQQLQKLLDK
ncbi:MAG: sigma-70 family RNA polymerase sigma factor [Desulfosporosinus sp.]|nr:sigma-70 family RNA polymerase sigma factor [Desulfosporosinus sp.]